MHQEESNNIGLKFDSDKSRVDLIPPAILLDIGKVFTHGAKKYGEKNWHKGIHYSRLYAAALRHIFKFALGKTIDEESGLPTLAHAIANLMMLMNMPEDWNDLYEKGGE